MKTRLFPALILLACGSTMASGLRAPGVPRHRAHDVIEPAPAK
jgi:hypothetical protein